MQTNKKDYVLYTLIVVLLILVGIAIGILINDHNKLEENSKTTDTEVIDQSSNEEKEEIVEEIKKEPVKDTETKYPTTTTIVPVYSAKDTKVINELNDTLKRVNTTSATNDKTFTESAKATFISIVDFLFYGGEIKGVTFKELTNSGKQKVLELASKIDSAIEKRIPGYKDTIAAGTSKAFNKASELIKKGATNIDNFLKSNLTYDEYNSLIDAKDDLIKYSKNAFGFVKDVGSSLFTTAKDKLNDWYINWKNDQ